MKRAGFELVIYSRNDSPTPLRLTGLFLLAAALIDPPKEPQRHRRGGLNYQDPRLR
jgi:hypothetical protein